MLAYNPSLAQATDDCLSSGVGDVSQDPPSTVGLPLASSTPKAICGNAAVPDEHDSQSPPVYQLP